ncbi:MAG: DUF2330 domain-containing protein [Candidatus Eisenbacteria sp.]|nr:DUF2330 domain-containing protein [Candidatus Eisenbacteria bacterium]
MNKTIQTTRSQRSPILVALLFLLLSVVSQCAWADGAFFSSYGKDIYEPSQKALIFYDSARQREDLIIQAGFEGNTTDFAWVVPVPSLPDLDTADNQLFEECYSLTKPLSRKRGSMWGCSRDSDTPTKTGGRDDIHIYDEQLVGIYQTLTVGADDGATLADSLEAWGYLHQENRGEAEAALQFYINKSWYFVAMKVDPSSSVWNSNAGGYWHGGLDPIRFSFDTEQIVYPMRISALSAMDQTEVLLYVCDSHRTTVDRATTEYANRIDEIELDHIQRLYPHLGEVLTGPCFFTKLRRTFTIDEMDDDIHFERAQSDAEFREINYTGLPFTEILLVAMIGITISGVRYYERKRLSA